MNLTRVKAITKKEFIQISRDARSLWMALMIPIFLLLIFGFALTFDVKNVTLVIWDQDNSKVSRDFIFNFKYSPYFRIVGHSFGYADIEESINKNKALLGLIIPYDFSKNILNGESTKIQLLADGSDSNTTGLAIGYVQTIVESYNQNLIKNKFKDLGRSFFKPIDLRLRIWFNEDLKSQNYIVPGLIAIIMMVIASLLTSHTVAKEWDRGTMEQLISTPISPSELILGKLIPYFLIGIVDVIIAVCMGEFIFHVPFKGSFFILGVLSCLFLIGTVCMGMFISIISKNQFIASQLSFLTTFLPSFLLSGFAFPIRNMPPFVQFLTNFVPPKFFITILKGIYLKGVGFNVLINEILFLTVFLFIMLLLALLSYKKKIL